MFADGAGRTGCVVEKDDAMNLRIVPLVILLMLSIALAFGLMRPALHTAGSHMIGVTPEFSVPSLDRSKALFSPARWKGKVVVLNVFASWCESCLSEQPQLMALSGKVPVMGLAWKDKPPMLRAWLKRHGNPFQEIGIDEGGKATMPLALSGVPETFVFDKNGKIAYDLKMPLTEEEMHNVLLPLVEKLQHE